MQDKTFAVYILANERRTVLYTGVTNDLPKRMFEHKTKIVKGFSAKYNCDRLVYFETGTDASAAIEREKQLKGGSRTKKIALIESTNLEWRDLSEGLA